MGWQEIIQFKITKLRMGWIEKCIGVCYLTIYYTIFFTERFLDNAQMSHDTETIAVIRAK